MRIRLQADADLNQIIVAAVLRRLPEADFRARAPALDAAHTGAAAAEARARVVRCQPACRSVTLTAC